MEKHAIFSGSALVFCWLMISLPHQGKTTTDHFGLKRKANFSKISLEAVRHVEIPWNTTVGCWLFGRLSWPLAQIEIRRKHSGQTLADTIEAFKDSDKYWQPTLDQHVTGMVFHGFSYCSCTKWDKWGVAPPGFDFPCWMLLSRFAINDCLWTRMAQRPRWNRAFWGSADQQALPKWSWLTGSGWHLVLG